MCWKDENKEKEAGNGPFKKWQLTSLPGTTVYSDSPSFNASSPPISDVFVNKEYIFFFIQMIQL